MSDRWANHAISLAAMAFIFGIALIPFLLVLALSGPANPLSPSFSYWTERNQVFQGMAGAIVGGAFVLVAAVLALLGARLAYNSVLKQIRAEDVRQKRQSIERELAFARTLTARTRLLVRDHNAAYEKNFLINAAVGNPQKRNYFGANFNDPPMFSGPWQEIALLRSDGIEILITANEHNGIMRVEYDALCVRQIALKDAVNQQSAQSAIDERISDMKNAADAWKKSLLRARDDAERLVKYCEKYAQGKEAELITLVSPA